MSPHTPAAPAEEEEVELSKEEEDFQAAKATLEGCEAAFKAASETLGQTNKDMEEEFVCYQAYWVDGLGASVDAIAGVAAAGVPVRASIWGKASPAFAPPEAPSSDSELPPAAPLASPELFSGLKAAVQKAGWNSDLSHLTTLEVELPPSPPGEKDGHAVSS